MSKALEDRLVAAKAELAKVEAVLLKHHGTGRIPADVVTQFNELAAFRTDVDAWCGMIAARRAALVRLIHRNDDERSTDRRED